ncbi:hypothetical protein [Mycobacterium sp. C31M]
MSQVDMGASMPVHPVCPAAHLDARYTTPAREFADRKAQLLDRADALAYLSNFGQDHPG